MPQHFSHFKTGVGLIVRAISFQDF